jgi:DNA (cytosine-5)-methyltransferase 1
LQGFPPGWTEYGDFDGIIKKISDSQRYKMAGNTVTTDVVEDIGINLKRSIDGC